jgi:hypothetical protein
MEPGVMLAHRGVAVNPNTDIRFRRAGLPGPDDGRRPGGEILLNVKGVHRPGCRVYSPRSCAPRTSPYGGRLLDLKEDNHVKLQVPLWQWVSRALIVALILTATPLPSFAGDPPAPAPARPTFAAMVEHAAAAMPLAPARAQAPGPKSGTTDLDSPSFFKKPVGIAVLLTMVAGVGYALYSTKHDRVHSPGKKGGGL